MICSNEIISNTAEIYSKTTKRISIHPHYKSSMAKVACAMHGTLHQVVRQSTSQNAANYKEMEGYESCRTVAGDARSGKPCASTAWQSRSAGIEHRKIYPKYYDGCLLAGYVYSSCYRCLSPIGVNVTPQ